MALGWVSFLNDAASEMIYPLLPDFVTRTLGAGPAALGLIEGIAESTASLVKVAAGWWSDRTRRRKPLVVAGYTIAAAARPLLALATSWGQVLAIRFSDRLGKGLRTPPRDALLASLATSRSRGKAFGIQRAMDNAGALVGPVLAALLLRFWIREERTLFLLALVPGLLALLLLVVRIPEKRQAVASEPAAPSGPMPRGLRVAIIVFALFTLANSTDAFLLLRARDCGIPVWQLPLLWAFFNGAKAAAGVPGGALSDRIGRIPTIASGWAIYALSYVGFAFASTPLAAWGLFGFYALFFAATEGAERALIADLAGERLRGRAFGAFHGAVGLAALPASVLFGLWWKLFGPATAFLIGAGLSLLATAALLAFRATMKAER
ncbi:MAG TPA: MFS transporter [Thermoanaerobaculia bacterium]|nr:MFS transporter [Thermoanaerobaculia bacterium]